MTTDTSEKGLESLIMRHMTGTDGLAVQPNTVAEAPVPYGGTGYLAELHDHRHGISVVGILDKLTDGDHFITDQFLADQLEQAGAGLESDGAILGTHRHAINSFGGHGGNWPCASVYPAATHTCVAIH